MLPCPASITIVEHAMNSAKYVVAALVAAGWGSIAIFACSSGGSSGGSSSSSGGDSSGGGSGSSSSGGGCGGLAAGTYSIHYTPSSSNGPGCPPFPDTTATSDGGAPTLGQTTGCSESQSGCTYTTNCTEDAGALVGTLTQNITITVNSSGNGATATFTETATGGQVSSNCSYTVTFTKQ
jgi:hypothetical protein